METINYFYKKKMYVLFDYKTIQSFKSNDLQIFKDYVEENANTNFQWWELLTDTKVVHSDCGRFTVENWGNDLKGIHYFQTLGAAGAEDQN
jgi:hypothetical protein